MSVFARKIIDEEWGNYFELTGAGYGALVAVMVAVLLVGCMVSGGDGKRKISTRALVFSAMAMALAMVTSMVKLIDMPMGGSVTLCSMFFVCLIGYIYGLRTGLMAAIAYGFLQLVVDPYIISIPQMFTDYIFGFGALGLSGIFSGKKNGMLIGYLAGALGRYFFTFLSGMIFFGSNGAAYHMSAPVYSLAYNGAYLVPEAVITVIIILMPPVNKALLKVKAMAN
ncbi:MAG: proton-coupled thiamine transporter YuaJ [Lachnospiraceae bacterium]|jgi:thiamine transporter|nr:proton-coupled thiamine transporter YuaJ [Lachnospiraceae bacterium]MCI9097978.1 proton-coupled thiamine transporter YuaJ [Lachnospiraceae bacterium]MCI9204393.1 proton-coupled thiamine transporter YuaJ [Lachnospiraceae bacterium]